MDTGIQNQAEPVAAHALHAMPRFLFQGMHAVDSLVERSRMRSDNLLEIMQSGRCIWLNNPGNHWQHRAYLLMYSPVDAAFFVVIVAVNEGAQDASIVTVLTQEQFENDRGPLDRGNLLRALKSMASKDVITAWRMKNPSQSVRRQVNEAKLRALREQQQKWLSERFSVYVDYRAESGVILRAPFFDPPGHEAATLANDAASIVKHPGFWDWFVAKAVEFDVPVETILCMKVKLPNATESVPLGIDELFSPAT